ncbi:glycoside hydrolase family 3 N-terminal domain-containing protein [Microbacter sp. GSS18]|nr:glycoside hydrolase family 3 N-terminal domain-containing protein [Microbacter sp. GSS18]
MLLAQMTLEEKIAQLGSTWPGAEEATGDVAPMQDVHRAAESFADAIRDGLGQLTRTYGTAPISAADGAAALAERQRRVVAANRFGIPAMAHEECLTGVTAWGCTVYPTPLAWGASFDPALVEEMGARIAGDLRALGVHQGLAPVLDVARDYRWGRVEETMGEDPHLVATVGTAYVSGIESAGIVATPKHFAGYAASRAGRNHAPVSMGPREFAEVCLPPFQHALGVARSVMTAYTDRDGVPATIDRELLDRTLRESWGFEGTVVTDYWAIPFVATMHGVAGDGFSAGEMALAAGCDVELPHTSTFARLADAVAAGRVDEAMIDRAVLRVLTQKAELGLLEPGWSADLDVTGLDPDSPENRDVARRLAEESIVVLRNDGILPLAGGLGRIAVLGPIAEDVNCLFGCYSFPNHVLPHHPGLEIGVDARSYIDAIRDAVPDAQITAAPGASLFDDGAGDLDVAIAAACGADIAVVFVGDRSGMFGLGTSGEGCDVADLRLPGSQQQLVDSVIATGTPTIVVVSSGRPYALADSIDSARAVIQAFQPGQEGGRALAGILTGAVNPSGRLPVQVPQPDAPQPGTYLAPRLGRHSDGISSLDPTPRFPFGYGLSFTTFERALTGPIAASMPSDGSVRIEVDIENAGDVPGADIPQLYVSYDVSTVVQPVRRLIGFARVPVDPGATRRVTFDVPADALSYIGRDLERVVEPGAVMLTVASSAADPGIEIPVAVTGVARVVRGLPSTVAVALDPTL